ncbi:hypothetical protein Tco_1268008, partial [Tanacetum coccineum]
RGALLLRRGVLLLMLTNKGWIDGNGLNPVGGFGKPRGGGATWVDVGDSLGDDEEVYNVVSKVKVLRVLEMMEHDSRACIYGALVSFETNEIFLNDKFPILDVWKKNISKDNGRI